MSLDTEVRGWRPARCGCYDGGPAGKLADPAPNTASPASSTGGLRLAAVIQPMPLPPLAVGVYGITAVCGILDAATFLGLGHAFVETMTGNILLLAFTVGARAAAEPTSPLPGNVLPYVVALACFAVGAVAGGRLVRAGEKGRQVGFVGDASLIGIAALVVALTHPGRAGRGWYLVVGILALAMGIQNALMRRWGIRDLATNIMTLTLTGLLAESTLGGGTNPHAARRGASIVIFMVGATAGAAMTGYGVLWPILASFTVFVLAIPILMQPPGT
jgi:uncharacterized membrane protein YoaK (UPF0700 family)